MKDLLNPLFISPYLLRPLRSIEQALRDISETRAAWEGRHSAGNPPSGPHAGDRAPCEQTDREGDSSPNKRR